MSEENPGTLLSRNIFRGLLLVILLAGLVVGLGWLVRSGLLQRALEWIQDLGAWGPLAFVVVYVIAVVLFVPASLFTVGAGFLFGLLRGSAYVLLAAMMGANLMFVIGRYFARDWVARKTISHPKFKAIDDAVAREGWKIVALIRLAPVFPFSVMSYAFGLTRIPLGQYFLANFTMIPGTMMYVYFGTIARDLTDKVAAPPWTRWLVGAITLLVVWYVTRFAKRALTRRLPAPPTDSEQ
jgi:uncharacterized membrane protein YdjX (TVP38/TMEM64 family)